MKTKDHRAAEIERAVELSGNRDLLAAFQDATQDTGLWQQVQRDPESFLRSRGVELPPGLIIRFFDEPGIGRPVPNLELLLVRLFNCRTWWRKRENEPGYEKVEVCFGFEIIRHQPPGGPIG